MSFRTGFGGPMTQPVLYLVGGFLGSGKTTLISQAATVLTSANRRVGVITNDQAGGLVDTRVLREAGFGVSEVTGGSFCCRFDDLIGAAGSLLDEFSPEVLLGEPVGSCTDLSATVLQPLKQLRADRMRL